LRYRPLDAILLLIALAGGVFVWRTGQEQARIRAKIERMSRTAGDLVVTDPSRVHVLALDTGEPLHFAWRVYLPADFDLVQQVTSGQPVGVSHASSSPSRELILRVRFRENAEGALNLYESLEDSNFRTSFGDESLAKVLHGRFDKVLVEQLGTRTQASVGVDEPLDLLSLRLPADMEAEVLKEMLPAKRARYDPQFFRFSFGPEAKKPSPSGEGEPIP
jgi:hypothetical protein